MFLIAWTIATINVALGVLLAMLFFEMHLVRKILLIKSYPHIDIDS